MSILLENKPIIAVEIFDVATLITTSKFVINIHKNNQFSDLVDN